MALIQTNTQPTTLVEKQAATKAQFQQLITNCFRQMKMTYDQGIRLVTKNQYGLTPEEVHAGMGADDAELTRLTTLLVTALNGAVAGTIPTT